MLAKKIVTMSLMCLIVVSFAITVVAEEEAFVPVVSFSGNISITADSYYGNLPDDPVDLDDREDVDLRKRFGVTNPSAPGFTQATTLNFYANPVPDLELNIKTSFSGKWGGGGTNQDLRNPLFVNEAYATYYTDWAMINMGRFATELDAFGLLVANRSGAREGISIHTIYKDTWVTGLYNRLLMSEYRDYPYVSDFLLDDLVALRLSRPVANNLVGLNLLFDGIYDEKGVSLDFNGKILGAKTKAQVSYIYPAWVYRRDKKNPVGERVWGAGLASITAYEDQNNIVTARLGYMGVGYMSVTGNGGETEMENPVKFRNNTCGIDLLYQRGLTPDTVLGVNMVYLHIMDKNFQKQLGTTFPTQIVEAAVTKYLSDAVNIKFATSLYRQDQNIFGRLGLSWDSSF